MRRNLPLCSVMLVSCTHLTMRLQCVNPATSAVLQTLMGMHMHVHSSGWAEHKIVDTSNRHEYLTLSL